MTKARAGLRHDMGALEDIAITGGRAFDLEFNDNGDIINRTISRQDADTFYRLTAETLSDGFSLAHDAVTAILSETKKASGRGVLSPGFMETGYTQRQLRKKVCIKSVESVSGWETVTTTPIQEAYRAVRRAIENNRAVRVANSRFIYLDGIATDPDSGAQCPVYDRLGLYTDIGGQVYNANGAPVAYTVSQVDFNRYNAIVKELNLTARQGEILSLRMRSYGYKAIATYLGIPVGSVRIQLNRIQSRAFAIGYARKNGEKVTTADSNSDN